MDDRDAADPAEERAGLPILAFADAQALDAWLERQPLTHAGIWLKLAKKGSAIASATARETVDAGLCRGWIDGLINAYDERHYLIRFTPRRPRSKWSLVNVERVAQLLAAGRMRPAGLAAVEAAKSDGRWDAAYPPASRIEVPADLAEALGADPAAAAFFATLRGADRYAILYRLHDAKSGARRTALIARYVAMLSRGETLG